MASQRVVCGGAGHLYVFLSDGTLLITSEHSKPALGTWQHAGGVLTMVEESIPYKVDILNVSAAEFRIRSHNPGGAVRSGWFRQTTCRRHAKSQSFTGLR